MAFERDPIPYALVLTGRLGRRDSNLCILESEFCQTSSPGAGLELAHLELKARPIDAQNPLRRDEVRQI